MIAPLTLADVAGNGPAGRIDDRRLAGLEADLDAELRSVEPIGDALTVLVELRGLGLPVAVASNLVSPMRAPRRILSGLSMHGPCLSRRARPNRRGR